MEQTGNWHRRMLVLLLCSTLSVPALAAEREDSPSAVAMIGDVFVARPLGVAATAIGSVAFVVSLPFSAAGGNVEEAANTLVVGPARETFVRCLGCTSRHRNGRY